MRRMKSLSMGFTAVILMMLVGCGGQTSTAPTVDAAVPAQEQAEEKLPSGWTDCEGVTEISFASLANLSSEREGNVLKHIEALHAQSDGALRIKLYIQTEFGSDTQLLNGVNTGTLSMMHSIAMTQCDTVPEMALLGIPAFFSDADALNQMLHEKWQDRFNEFYHAQGLHLLGAFSYKTHSLISLKPIETALDIEGLKVRCLNRYQRIFWQAMGAEPVIILYSEMRLAAQQNLIEAHDIAISSGGMSQFYPTYFVRTQHSPVVQCYVINWALYQSLTAQEQQWLVELIQNIQAETAANAAQEDADLEQEYVEHYGLQIIEDLPGWSEVSANAREQVLIALREDLGDALVDEFVADYMEYAGG